MKSLVAIPRGCLRGRREETVGRLAVTCEEGGDHRLAVDQTGQPCTKRRGTNPAGGRVEPEIVDRVPAGQARQAERRRGIVAQDAGISFANHAQISLADPQPEFRIELYNIYPPDDPKTASVTIRELQWHYATYSIAVWLHRVKGKWIVLNTCRWKEGVVF